MLEVPKKLGPLYNQCLGSHCGHITSCACCLCQRCSGDATGVKSSITLVGKAPQQVFDTTLCTIFFQLCCVTQVQQVCTYMVFKFLEAGPATVTRWAIDISLAFLLQILWFRQFPGAVPTLGAIIITVTITLEGIRKHQAKKISQIETPTMTTSEESTGSNSKV